ncbi:MAG: undecaprenyldiphospho-muramoylpentapeptide beta-N-acetylglucosaminyltransferase [Rubrobacter sp.]
MTSENENRAAGERPADTVETVIIAGGGTGGHAIPALCVAESLRDFGVEAQFIGSTCGIEATLVPQAGFRLHSLPLSGFTGNPIARLKSGALFARAAAKCRRLLSEIRPVSVLGVGGYASAPAVAAARSLGIPTFLHEQNSVPGRVNKIAGRFTRKNFITFPAASENLQNAIEVGMPTRRQFFDVSRDEALEKLGLEPPVALIFGGSGGALKLNTAAEGAFREKTSTSYTVVQVAGRRDYPQLSTDNTRHVILEYVDDIWRYIAASSVIVSRAGAGSLFDVAAVGRAAVLIPFPHATGDHQLHNARYFTERGAAELLLDSDVNAGTVRDRVEGLLGDDARRERFAGAMKSLATPGASDAVAKRLVGAGKFDGGER